MRKSNLVKIAVFLGVMLLPVGGISYAYYEDQEHVDENAFQTGTLEIELDEKNDEASESPLSPTGYVERYFEMKNMGTIGFDYSLGAEDITGDDAFCDDIQVKAYMGDSEDLVYEGELINFVVNTEEMYLDVGPEEAKFKLNYYLPNLADSAESLTICEFKIVAKAWMEGYEYGKAYYDSSDVSQMLESGDWMIEMGYESGETLDAGTDGNPPLGFCGIKTEDKSGDDTTHLQIKWEKVEGTEKYVLHMFVQDTEWLSGGTTDLLLTDPNLSEDSGIMTYETMVSEEGLYGYYIQAFNLDDELIGATTPNKEDFTCTFEVDWEEEEETEPLGLLMINPLVLGMTDDHDDNEDEDTSTPELPGDILDEVLETETLPETTYEETGSASE